MKNISFKTVRNKRITGIIAALGIIVFLSFAVSKSKAYAAYYASAERKTPIYCVEINEKKISISFDCAWGTEKTDGLLEVMDYFNVKCTFFATEFWVEKNPEYVKKIYNAGHDIGTHSATHPHMSALTSEEIKKELESSAYAIEKVTGKKVTLFRPPFGDYNNLLINECEKLGLFPIQWDVDSLDWKDLSANEIAKRIISKAKNGSIILCHNNAKHTLEALPLVFLTLQRKGYEFVKISELIYKENYTIDSSGKQITNKLA